MGNAAVQISAAEIPLSGKCSADPACPWPVVDERGLCAQHVRDSEARFSMLGSSLAGLEDPNLKGLHCLYRRLQRPMKKAAKKAAA